MTLLNATHPCSRVQAYPACRHRAPAPAPDRCRGRSSPAGQPRFFSQYALDLAIQRARPSARARFPTLSGATRPWAGPLDRRGGAHRPGGAGPLDRGSQTCPDTVGRGPLSFGRRRRDLNPREVLSSTRLAGGRTRPLCDASEPGSVDRQHADTRASTGYRCAERPGPNRVPVHSPLTTNAPSTSHLVWRQCTICKAARRPAVSKGPHDRRSPRGPATPPPPAGRPCAASWVRASVAPSASPPSAPSCPAPG